MTPLKRVTCLLLLLSAFMLPAFTAPAPPPPFPFDPPPLAALRRSPRKVFAHYFTQFPISLDNRDPTSDYYAAEYLKPEGEGGAHRGSGGFLRARPLPRPARSGSDWQAKDMEEEVRRAAALGLDGFAVDILDYQGYHWDHLKTLMVAAPRVDPGFKILLMPDMDAAFGAHPEKLAEVITGLSHDPAAYRLADGRLVLSPYDAQDRSAAWWKDWLAARKAEGLDIAFVPLFQDWSRYAKDYGPISYGLSDWGWRSPKAQAVWRTVPAQAHKFAPVWMMPVAPQDARPNSFLYTEAGNSQEFRVMWENAIQGGADWVQLITWNDYSENAQVAPSTGTQYAFYDLAAYYTTWFKTGKPPKITRDVLYYFHRTQSTDAAPDLTKQTRPFTLAGGSDPPVNQVELLAFLTKPGVLEIALSGQTRREYAPAGMTSFRVPLAEGRPVFRLLRGGKAVITLPSAFPISNKITYQDPIYHAGSNRRPPVVSP